MALLLDESTVSGKDCCSAGSDAMTTSDAPGAPGIPPMWTSSAKDAVGTSLRASRVWFTLGRGIVNEVFYPHVDTPQVRDLGFIVADHHGFWCEVKRENNYHLTAAAPGIPAFSIEHRHERFSLHLRIYCDPQRDVLFIDGRLDGDGLTLYALLAPHLGGLICENRAAIERYGIWTALGAELGNGDVGCALLAVNDQGRCAWRRSSCGYVGVSDGWQDFHEHRTLTWNYPRAGPGNVALIGELASGPVRMALAFERSVQGACTLAAAALASPVDECWHTVVKDWEAWHTALAAKRPWTDRDLPAKVRDELATSAMVLKVHQDKDFLGAMVASLSTPWGQSRHDEGGYHLVWPRDLVETSGALLAVGDHETARHILQYLIATQQSDGRWYQNQWLSGHPFWRGIQLDEIAFPILLAASLADQDALGGIPVAGMIARAASFLARYGPVTPQDRWENDAGLNPFTLAVSIAALVCAGDFLEGAARTYVLELADAWNANIERWTYVEGDELHLGVAGHFVRSAPAEALEAPFDLTGWALGPDADRTRTFGLECLALVRMGLRRADDARIRESIKAIDALLRVETPSGALWRRYLDDPYGEHADGAPFDGTGIGRAWPLLAGERGHYALATGEDPLPYLRTMCATSSRGGMIPEQVWDSPSLADRGLYCGKPTGSANPLVWAHAEFIKLCASLIAGQPFDRRDAVTRRYGGSVPNDVPWDRWSFQRSPRTIRTGKVLRIETEAPATILYTCDNWTTVNEAHTREIDGLGIHVADLAAEMVAAGGNVEFTFHWQTTDSWEGRNITLRVGN
jgi:glucoamylase